MSPHRYLTYRNTAAHKTTILAARVLGVCMSTRVKRCVQPCTARTSVAFAPLVPLASGHSCAMFVWRKTATTSINSVVRRVGGWPICGTRRATRREDVMLLWGGGGAGGFGFFAFSFIHRIDGRAVGMSINTKCAMDMRGV